MSKCNLTHKCQSTIGYYPTQGRSFVYPLSPSPFQMLLTMPYLERQIGGCEYVFSLGLIYVSYSKPLVYGIHCNYEIIILGSDKRNNKIGEREQDLGLHGLHHVGVDGPRIRRLMRSAHDAESRPRSCNRSSSRFQLRPRRRRSYPQASARNQGCYCTILRERRNATESRGERVGGGTHQQRLAPQPHHHHRCCSRALLIA